MAGADLKLPKRVSLKDLDPRREIRTRWDRNFDTWHDYYFGTSAMPRIYLDEMGFLQYFTQSGENWAFLPVSIARTMVKNAPLSIHELDIKPPNRTVYYIYRLQDASPYQDELLKLYKQELRNVPGVVLKANDE